LSFNFGLKKWYNKYQESKKTKQNNKLRNYFIVCFLAL